MDSLQFTNLRKKLKKTQQELARLMGTSVKAIHSYEQGWRTVPAHVERQLLLLACMANGRRQSDSPCWVLRQCPEDRRERCPAWEFQAGDLCWFINGTFCEGAPMKNWQEKMRICGSCAVLTSKL